MGVDRARQHQYVLWLCDHCDDNAEVEPGGRCEVCGEGTIQVVAVVRRGDPLDIYGTAQVCELLGVSRETLRNWMNDPNHPFPRPAVIGEPGKPPRGPLPNGHVWDGPEMRAYVATHRKGT